jgi:hypothetical protein
MTAERDAEGIQHFWTELVDPYVKSGGNKQWPNDGGDNLNGSSSTSIYVCPDYQVAAPAVDEAGNPNGQGGPFTGSYPLQSYSPNVDVTTAWWALNGGPPGTWAVSTQDWYSVGTDSSITIPAQQIMMCDNIGGTETEGCPGPGGYGMARHHGKGMDYSLMDGHAKWYPGPTPQYGYNTFPPDNARQLCGAGTGNGWEAQGSSVASWLPDEPNAPIFFAPRAGK